MSRFDTLLKDFATVSREEWLAKIAADLKGKSISDLNWKAENQLSFNPFVSAEETRPLTVTDRQLAASNRWSIFEEVIVTDAALANGFALEALAGGAEGLWLELNDIAPADLRVLFEGIRSDYIFVNFGGTAFAKNPLAFLKAFHQLAQSQQLSATELRGSIRDVPFGESLIECMVFCRSNLPEMAHCVVSVENEYSENSVEKLAQLLRKGEDLISMQSMRPLEVQFSMGIGRSYFLSMAQLRAFRLLWANVLKAYKLLPAPTDAGSGTPVVHVNILFDDEVKDEYTQIIYATTQAMSAVMGGISTLRIRPSVAPAKAIFTQHITRNLQHLFQMESYLDRVVDPAEGSYYIEQLTNQLAEKAWERFQQL